MINLLPPDIKQHYMYARRNTRLLGWLWAFGAGLAGLVVIAAFGMVYMQRSIHNVTSQVNQAKSLLADQHVNETKAEISDISNSLKLVVQVLSNEVLFSQLLKQIGTIVPANASLTGLSISKVQGAVDLTANAVDYNAATQLQVNLQDPRNKIFAKADIINITCSSGAGADPQYPCTTTIRALFNTNNPFLFINLKGSKQ